MFLAAVGAGAGCSSPNPPAEWVEAEGYRSQALAPEGRDRGFVPVAGTGIDFIGHLSDSAFVENRHRVNGAGVALGDVDGDGLPDVFLAGLEARSRLYRNLGGFRFEDITDAAGVGLETWYNTGAAFLDTDGDGDLDLTVTTLDGPSMLFHNDGSGRFTEDGTWPGRLAGPRGGTSIAAADVDADGDLDVYVTNYKARTVKDLYPPATITFEETVDRSGDVFSVRPPYDAHYRVEVQDNRVMRYEYAEPDMLLINTPDGFTDGTSSAFPGDLAQDWGLAAQFRDLDGDGDPDLYVCNDFESPDHVWLNRGDGVFSRAPMLALRHTAQSSMAVDGSDVDRDGDIDIFVTEMLSRTHSRRLRQVGNPPPTIARQGEIQVRPQVMHNTMLMARPSSRTSGRDAPEYADAAWAMNVAASEWSWTAAFMDVDLDGWEDLLVTTGHRYDAMDLDAQTSLSGRPPDENWTAELLKFPDLDLQNVAFRNRDGAFFDEMPDGWGIGTEEDVTHGLALGDLDGDGDLDVVTNRLNRPAGIFRNDAAAPRIAVRLKGRGSNTHGIGARVVVEGGGLTQQREILAGGYYLSGSDPMAVFAALADPMTLTVHWPGGAVSTLLAAPNRLYEVEEPDGTPAERVRPVPPPPMFEDTQLATHTDAVFEDRSRQPLFLRRLSAEGPYAAVGDFSGDGRPDVVIGTGGGGYPAVYLNEAGALTPVDAAAYPVSGMDWGGVAIADGRILAGVSGYESGTASRLDQFTVAEGRLVDRGAIDLGNGSPGPLAVADIDGDGDQDVFVGMRFLPNRYPESVPSAIFLREGDGLRRGDDMPAGLVTGAAFADADGDGDQDLAVASEYGPVRLFENDGLGTFRDRTAEWGLDGERGLWRSVTWGDVNSDGLPDLIATNWGWNSPHGRVGAADYDGRGLRLYWGDFDRNGSIDPVQAEYAPELDSWAPTLKLMDLVRGLRYVTRRVESAEAYARSSLEEILGPPFSTARFEEANQLGHLVWLNTGGRFEARLLPEEAQWVAASGSVLSDINDDGDPDLILSQNFFPVLPESATRQDGGNGMILLGDGQGGFQVSGEALGLYGDGRAILAVDLDGDGRSEIIATQNAAPARLFRRLR